MPKTIDTKQANNSKAKRRWFSPRLIIVSLVLLVIVIAAIILFSRQQPIITKKFPTGVSENQKENPASLLEKSNVFKAKIPPGNVKEMPAKEHSITPKVPVDQQNSIPTSIVRSPQPGAVASLKKPPQKRPTSKDTAASKKSGAAGSVPSGKPATKVKKPDRTRTYDRIDNSKLKLQALAWFNDASKRMAVINSHIVREGGSVEGYQVTQIRRQDVVVSDGKKSWSLEFGLKH